MSSSLKNLSSYDASVVPDASPFRFGIVVSEWNHAVTGALLDGAVATLKKHGASDDYLFIRHVPGSYELTAGGQFMAEYMEVDAVICLGCVIQGETRHFDFICQAVSAGLTELTIKYNLPFIFGVLTPDNMEQALDRAGGRHGNKGDEAAVTAIKMAALQKELRTAKNS